MPTEILQKTGGDVNSIIVLGKSATHNPADVNDLGNITDEIDLTSLAAGAARQSAKFDFGALRADKYNMMAALEWNTDPIPGEVVDFWLAFSPSATPANANPGGVSGLDSAYTGYSANLDDSIKQLTFIGSFVLTEQSNPGFTQKAVIGSFFPLQRYATLVVHNRTVSDPLYIDMVEMSVLITPIVTEGQ